MHTQPQLLLSPQPLSERRFEKQPRGHRSVLSALPLRKWVTEVNTAAAMLMTLQGAALGLACALPCSRYHQRALAEEIAQAQSV